jgi:KDO2-lipid IV(A) lauroyltransferase
MLWLLAPLKLIPWAISRLPWFLQRAIGAALGLIWFDVLRIRRQVVINNLKIAYPEMSLADRRKLGRLAMIEFCTNIIQYSWIPFLDKDSLERHFIIEGLENLEKARAKGKGVAMLTLHIGNGDLAVAGLGLMGLPVHLVSKVMKAKWLNDLWFGMRERVGVRFIEPRNSSFAILKAFKRNEIVIFVNDQFTGPPIGIKARFFNHDAGTALGLATMVERSGSPVVPVYNLRLPDGRIRIVFEPEIPFEQRGDHDQSLAHMTQAYNDRLEQYVRMCPQQWMWIHKRWKLFKY